MQNHFIACLVKIVYIDPMETVQNKDIETILEDLVKFIDEKMGNNNVVLDVSQATTLTSYVVVTTATSQSHAGSLGKSVIDFFLEHGHAKWLHTRNPDLKNPWVLVDAGDIVVHIFLEDTREFYNIEKVYFQGDKIIPDQH